MKKNLIPILLLGMTVTFFSCSTLMDIYLDALSPKAPVTGRAEKHLGMAIMDAAGISDMQAVMVASMVFMQVFITGGYAGGYADYSEGRGIDWEVNSTQNGDEE
jgi:hypothetical protein